MLDNDKLTDTLIYKSVKKGIPLNKAIDETLKGKEIRMPEGLNFTDKDGTKRTEIRIKWWEDPLQTTYKNISIEPIGNLPEILVDLSHLNSVNYYTPDDKMVFFGHYWLKGNPTPYRKNICCLDYSVAKGGHLVAYRLDEENKLDERKLIFV